MNCQQRRRSSNSAAFLEWPVGVPGLVKRPGLSIVALGEPVPGESFQFHHGIVGTAGERVMTNTEPAEFRTAWQSAGRYALRYLQVSHDRADRDAAMKLFREVEAGDDD